jgi:hypothetical protein
MKNNTIHRIPLILHGFTLFLKQFRQALLPGTNCMTILSELLPAFTLLPLIYAAAFDLRCCP